MPDDALKGISSMATRKLLADLARAYERESGQRVEIVSIGGVDAARRVRSGERFDFVVLASNVIDELAAQRHVDPSRRVDVARSGVAIGVRSGSPRPNLGSEATTRDAVLAARNIGYSTGPSGTYLMQLFERWGIAAAMAGRIVQAPPGVPVATLIARGDVELGFQQASELIDIAGVDVAGPLPRAIQLDTIFSAAVCATSTKPDPSFAALTFFASAATDPTKRCHGMEPALRANG